MRYQMIIDVIIPILRFSQSESPNRSESCQSLNIQVTHFLFQTGARIQVTHFLFQTRVTVCIAVECRWSKNTLDGNIVHFKIFKGIDKAKYYTQGGKSSRILNSNSKNVVSNQWIAVQIKRGEPNKFLLCQSQYTLYQLFEL